MRRWLALGGVGGFSLGSLAMALGNYLRTGLDSLVVLTLAIGLAVGVVFVFAVRDTSVLNFDDPQMRSGFSRWAPYSLAALGTLVLLIGLLVLLLALT